MIGNQDDIDILNNCTSDTSKSDVDVTDQLPQDLSISIWDLLALVLAIVSHLMDVFIDLNVTFHYFQNDQILYLILTIVFIAVPSMINIYMSSKIYNFQDDIQRTTKKLLNSWLLLPFLLIFQLAPVLRYWDVLRFALKSRRAAQMGNYQNQRKYYSLMAKEDSYVSLLRIFECFLEAVPQQILQICIVLLMEQNKNLFNVISQYASIASSTVSIAWAMASYYKNARIAYENRKNIGHAGTILQFLWHIMITVSRILCLSLAASAWPVTTGILCMTHWICMTLWINYKCQSITFCMPSNKVDESRIMKFFFSTILGLVYITTYLSPSEGQGKSRNQYIVYYGVFLLENLCAVTIWTIEKHDDYIKNWYYYPLIIGSISSFFIGILFMLIYYKFFHPFHKLKKIQIYESHTTTNNINKRVEDVLG